MKHRIMSFKDSYNELVEYVVIDLDSLDLGNNFTLGHFFNALSEEQHDYIYNIEHDGSETVFRLKAGGNYGGVRCDICSHDLWDYMRPLYR